jgi:hypothetical protein
MISAVDKGHGVASYKRGRHRPVRTQVEASGCPRLKAEAHKRPL